MTKKINDYTYAEKQKALDEAWEIMNPTSNAERLEQVKKNSIGLTDNEGCFADIVQLDVDDYAWLIERAKRVEYLETEYRVRRVELLEEHIERLEKENSRLREDFRHIVNIDSFFMAR